MGEGKEPIDTVKQLMSTLEKINNFMNRILMIIGSLALLSLMFIATMNAFLRYSFTLPWKGTYEIVSFLGAILIAFGLGYSQKNKAHIIVDILSDKFPISVKRVLDGISYFIGVILFATVSWQIFMVGLRIWNRGEVSETLQIIYYPIIFAVSLGFAIFSLALLNDFMNNLTGGKGTEE